MENFNTKSVKHLHAYLRERGVVTLGYLKAKLVELCEAAQQLGLQIVPDGLIHDRAEVIEDKLKTSSGSLVLPTFTWGLWAQFIHSTEY